MADERLFDQIITDNEPLDTDSAPSTAASDSTDANIITLEWQEHVRRRPGMYIGKLGDGSTADDGIYVLLKEVVDNSIDEYMMGFGNKLEINVTETSVTVRDYGRGIPLGKLVDASSKMNTDRKSVV